MTKEIIRENIEIARRYLNTFHLLLTDREIVSDCYCLPSLGWKAFYAQVFVGNGVYRANCAYTSYADHFGVKSNSCHFSEIERDKHPARKNDVFCKTIFLDSERIDRLFHAAHVYSSGSRIVKEGIVIDGITAGIRLFKNGIITHDICLIDPEDPDPLLDEICSFSELI